MPTAQSQNLRLSDAQLQSLTYQVIDHRDEALQARGDFPIRHADRYRRYLADPSLRPPGPWPGAPSLFVPITRAIFERLHSEIWQATFGDLRQITMVPFGDEDQINAELATRFLRWTLTQTLQFSHISSMLFFDALLDSVAVSKVSSWVPPWPPPSPDARRFLRRQSKIDPLDLGMLLVAPDAEGLQYPECRYVHQEFFLDFDTLVRMKHRGFDIPAYDQLGDSQQLSERKRIELEREGERVIEFRPDSVPFVESYERFDLDTDDQEGEQTDIIVSWFPDAIQSGTSNTPARIAAVRRLIDVYPQDDRPRRPFFDHTIWPQPRQWRGLNVPDRLETMQDLINRLTEQMVNYGDVSMLPFVFANTFLTGELPSLRQIEPGSVVPIDDLNGLQFAPTRSLNRHFAEQIQLAMSNIERDMNTTDFNLGRQPDRPNAPRTASATMAILAESRKSFSMLVRHAVVQFQSLLAFHFRLWQDILPDDTHVQIFPQTADMSKEEGENAFPKNLFDRLFSSPSSLSETGRPLSQRYVALPISKDALSGFFDVQIEVNPEEAFDRQVMLQLFQLSAPLLQNYPLGLRLMLKRIWASNEQHGFDEIWPEEMALLQTKTAMDMAQIQLAQAEQQLAALHQQEAQQQLQTLESLGQQQLQGLQSAQAGGQPTGSAINPQFLSAIQSLLAQHGAGNGQTPPATNGATNG